MKKILIVEDDQIVANIYRNKFAVAGYEVEIAPDGELGLESLRTFRPDAVILDLMLPGISGVELLRRVRAEPEFAKLPIIVFSNTYLSNMVQEAWKAGASKCLSKASCSPKQLLDVVRNSLGGNGALSASPAPAAAVAADQPPPRPTVAAQPPAPASLASSIARAPETAENLDAETAFQADLRRPFLGTLPGTLATLRNLLQSVLKASDDPARLEALDEMYRRIHGVTSNAGATGMIRLAQVSDALEVLIKELRDKPKNINASTLRTIATAIDFLAQTFNSRGPVDIPETSSWSILVVDDEAISRRAITYALEKAKLTCVSLEDPQVALQKVSERSFDLIFLDVDMPGMNGYELCSKLRALSDHKKTPVVFVTGLNDLASRASSMVSGGTDFIAKPFLFIELAVKALVHLLRGRLAPRS